MEKFFQSGDLVVNTDNSVNSWPSCSKFMMATSVALVSSAFLFACTTSPGPAVPNATQGKWLGTWTSETKTSANGRDCLNGTISFEVVGSNAGGKSTNENGQVFDVSAIVSSTNNSGDLSAVGQCVGQIWGKLSDDGISGSGEWEDMAECKGTWYAAKA